MNVLPDDITTTIPQRHVTIRRDELPDLFGEDPGGVLKALAAEYGKKVSRVDPKLADAHHDWTVRIRLQPGDAAPVTDVGVVQRGQWVEFRGMVVRVKDPVPRAMSVAWVCGSCDKITFLDPHMRPGACSCKSRNFEKSLNLSPLIDSQDILLGEDFEEVRGSGHPRTLACRLDGTLIQKLKAGDRCVVGGIMDIRDTKKGMMYELLVNNTEQFRPVREVEAPDIRGDPLDALVESFAPQVFGNHNIKEAVLLAMAGGGVEDGRRVNIHILLVGDPGIAKSTILKEAVRVAPLGRYASGRGSTAAGLTAGIARDRDGVMYLEAGAAILVNGGLLCLDEFEKTRKSDLTALHEAMEQQTVSIAKTGAQVTMNAQISVLAAANPKQGFWDESLSLTENIDLPQSLLTRFDLIYNLRDVPDADTDRNIADHILSGGKNDTPLSPEEITAYVSSIRGMSPTMSDEAASAIKQYYVRARAAPGEIRITPRQMEAIRRLAGAYAKIYRRDTIAIEDATRAIKLVESMIQYTLVDPNTGKPDMAKAVSGQSRSAMRRVDEIISAFSGSFTASDVALKTEMSFRDIERILVAMNERGVILEEKPGVYRTL